MASNYDFFNPTPQDVNVPDFRNYTKEVTAPQPNKGLEVALTAAGKGIKDVGEIVKDSYKLDDFLHKESARNAAYAAADPEYERQEAALSDTLRGLGGNPGNDLIPGEARAVAVPKDLQGIPAEAERWASAKELKAMGDLEYSARLSARQKELRSAFPGYRDYIDKEFTKATGKDVANYRLTALREGITALQSAMGDPVKRALEVATRETNLKMVPNMNQHVLNIQNGVPGAIEKMYSDVARFGNSEYQQDQRLKSLTVKGAERTDLAFSTGLDVDKTVAENIKNILDSEKSNSGFTLQKAMDLDEAVRTGKIPTQEVAAMGIKSAATIDQYINKIRGDMIKRGLTPDASGKILADNIGGMKNYTERVDESLKYLTQIRDSYAKGDISMGNMAARLAAARNESTYNEIVGDPKYGKTWSILENLKRFGSDAVDRYFREILTSASKTGMNEQLVSIAANVGVRTADTPNLAEPAPVKAAISRIDNSSNLSSIQKSRLADTILTDALSVTDPNMPRDMKKNKLDNFFNDASSGLLSLVNPDFINEKGRNVRGRQSIYTDFTDPKMVKVAKDIGGQTWTNYQSFMKKEFSEQLFKQDIKDLHALGQVSPNIHIGWNDVDHRWVLDYRNFKDIASRPSIVANTDKEISLAEMHALNQSSKIVTRLNSGINSYTNVLREAGGDVNAELIRTMKEAGLESPEYTGDNLVNRMGEAFKTLARHFRSEMKKPAKDVIKD